MFSALVHMFRNFRVFNKFWIALSTAGAVFFTFLVDANMDFTQFSSEQWVAIMFAFLGAMGVRQIANRAPRTTVVYPEEQNGSNTVASNTTTTTATTAPPSA